MTIVAENILHRMSSQNHWPGLVANDVLWCKEYDAMFAACSKNACSKIKHLLANLRAHRLGGTSYSGSPHNRKETGLLGIKDVSIDEAAGVLFGDGTFRFAFVRNPFGRVISCYKNRIDSLGTEKYDFIQSSTTEFLKNRSRILAWKTGFAEVDVNPNDHISFNDFVGYICDQDPFQMDRHWYHQNRSIHHDFIDFDFIGRVEDFDADMEHVFQEIGAEDFEWSRTKLNSSGKITNYADFFNPELEEKFVSVFAEDFETFGYENQIKRPGSRKRRKKTQTEDRSMDISKYPNTNLEVIIRSWGDTPLLRDTVNIIRARFGEETSVRIVCALDGDRYISDFARISECRLEFVGDDANTGALNARALENTTSDYLLTVDEGVVPTSSLQIKNAKQLIQSNDEIAIVGGRILPKDVGNANAYWENASLSLRGSDKNSLILSPIEYFLEGRYSWKAGTYRECDTLSTFTFCDVGRLRQEQVVWDEGLDGMQSYFDFYLQMSGKPKMRAVHFDQMTSHRLKNDISLEDELPKLKTLNVFMKKWGLDHLMFFGRCHLLYDEVTDVATVFPFSFRDSLGNPTRKEDLSFFYADRIPGTQQRQISSSPKPTSVRQQVEPKPPEHRLPPRRAAMYPLYLMFVGPFLNKRNAQRLYDDPFDLFGRAKHPAIKFGQSFFGFPKR